MSEPKENPWTPGPWHWKDPETFDWPGESHFSARGIASLEPSYSDSTLDFENAADARLVALAPEMAELLELATRIEDEGWDLALNVQRNARTLLNRARGEVMPRTTHPEEPRTEGSEDT